MKYCWSREIYRFSQQQFLNANFAWNQDEVPQNSREAKRFYYSRQLSAQSGSCQTNQLRSSSLLFGTLSHGAHEPISVVLRTSFLDALKQLRHLAVRVKPISFALRACFLGHYRMARMSQSASPCGLASWMRPHMVPNAHLLKLLFPTRYTSRSIYQSFMCDSQSA